MTFEILHYRFQNASVNSSDPNTYSFNKNMYSSSSKQGWSRSPSLKVHTEVPSRQTSQFSVSPKQSFSKYLLDRLNAGLIQRQSSKQRVRFLSKVHNVMNEDMYWSFRTFLLCSCQFPPLLCTPGHPPFSLVPVLPNSIYTIVQITC